MFGPAEPAARALQQAAEARGFVTAWAPGNLPPDVVDRYHRWVAGGRHAGMGQLARTVDVRLKPQSRLAWVRSALVLAAPHGYPDPGCPAGGVRVGRVGRVFWVREQDYIQRLVQPQVEELKAICHELGGRCRDYVEQGPLSFRSYGALSGLGWVGRNAMLIHPVLGSYFTLAVLLTSFEVELRQPHPNRCGRCRVCVDRCPGGALAGDGTLDANRCVAYWTTQHLDLIPPSVWGIIGNWVLGCDECQQVCPWSPKAPQSWAGYRPEPDLAHPDLRDFLTLSNQAFAEKYGGSAFERVGRPRMARNALIVLANTGDESYVPLVRLGVQDSSPLVRTTAAWALVRLGARREVERLLADPDPTVRDGACRALESDAESMFGPGPKVSGHAYRAHPAAPWAGRHSSTTSSAHPWCAT